VTQGLSAITTPLHLRLRLQLFDRRCANGCCTPLPVYEGSPRISLGSRLPSEGLSTCAPQTATSWLLFMSRAWVQTAHNPLTLGRAQVSIPPESFCHFLQVPFCYGVQPFTLRFPAVKVVFGPAGHPTPYEVNRGLCPPQGEAHFPPLTPPPPPPPPPPPTSGRPGHGSHQLWDANNSPMPGANC